MTDKQIIEHLQYDKYALAWKGLYNVFSETKQYVKANSGSVADAEDIFQDALVILYKKVREPDFTLTSSLKVYLFAVVKNCWLQELRKRKRLPPGTLHSEPAMEIDANAPAYDCAATAFNLLGDKCRQLLTLFYFKKKSMQEIAATMAFSDEHVAKNQKYRCIQKAKENYRNLSNDLVHEK